MEQTTQSYLATESLGKLMGKYAASTMLSMVREIVFGVGFALLLPVFFGLDGLLYSMPVSDVLTAVVSAIVIVMTYRQLSKKTEENVV